MAKSQSLILLSTLILLELTTFGQSIVEVSANQLSVETGVPVVKGETYQISAEGEWQDADFPPSDANGFKGFTTPMFFGMLLKPMPSQYYMKLCGKVGNWKFPIGSSATITIKRDGELLLFANDAKGFYDNNSGILKVAVKKMN